MECPRVHPGALVTRKLLGGGKGKGSLALVYMGRSSSVANHARNYTLRLRHYFDCEAFGFTLAHCFGPLSSPRGPGPRLPCPCPPGCYGSQGVCPILRRNLPFGRVSPFGRTLKFNRPIWDTHSDGALP